MLHVNRASCVLRVGVLGINFKTADLALREAIARGAESLTGERGRFFPHPHVLLSTCNRTEIYFSAEDLAETHSDLLALLRRQVDESFEHRLYSYFGIDCFSHLCKVVAGLDSAILAETEIQRQVKVAYTRAKDLPSALHYIFQKGLKVGKEVRSELELERGAPTLYGTIWQLAKEQLGDLRQKKILLVGHSEINRGFASFLLHKGMDRFALCTQNPSSVKLEGAMVCDRGALADWPSYDCIVCASKADDYLISGASPQTLIFDLSVPRNVDPEVKATLWNIEQLNQLIEQKRKAQRNGLERSEVAIGRNVLRLARIFRLKSERSYTMESAGS